MRLAEGRNLNIAAKWQQQGSSDRLKLDSGWGREARRECCTGCSAKDKDVKAWAGKGLRGAETALASPEMQTRRDAGSFARLGCNSGRSRCGVAESSAPGGSRVSSECGWMGRQAEEEDWYQAVVGRTREASIDLGRILVRGRGRRKKEAGFVGASEDKCSNSVCTGQAVL